MRAAGSAHRAPARLLLDRGIGWEGHVIIAFGSTRLREICEDPNAADAYLGTETGEALRARLADIRAAVTVEDLPVGQPSIGGHLGEELGLSLGGSARLVLRANHTRQPLNADGRVDWDKVAYVQVLGIERP